MSKTKRLLSVTLAIAMIILSAFSAFAEDTETVVKTVGAMSVAAVSIENDDTTFDVNVKISFNEVVTGPHNIITLTCEKFNLTDVELGDVVYTYTDSEAVPDIGTVQLPQGKVTIAEDGVKNVNWATGKVLIEAPVDGTAPLVSEINLTATFTLKTDVDLVAGETLNIAVANDDMADASETKLSISSGASVVTVHGAGTTLDDVFPITITPTVSTFTVNGSTGFTREGDTSSALCYNFVAENYGTMQSVGLAMTIDGTVPTVESNAACFETTLKAGSSFITGANYAKGISYTGMNVMQFDTDVKYVGFISYLDETTQSVQYLYTSPIIVNFADCLKEMADDELATKVLKMYNDVDAGIGLTGTYAVSEKFSSLTITYDVDAFSVNGSTSFVKADANSGEYSNYVAENYGTVGSIGVALSIDGTDPTVESNAAYFETTLKAGSSFLTAANYAKGLSYTGMNITQLGTECKFAIFSQYTSTDGSTGYVYVDTISVKLIDILRGIEDNEAVTNIVEIYDAVN